MYLRQPHEQHNDVGFQAEVLGIDKILAPRTPLRMYVRYLLDWKTTFSPASHDFLQALPQTLGSLRATGHNVTDDVVVMLATCCHNSAEALTRPRAVYGSGYVCAEVTKSDKSYSAYELKHEHN